MKPEDREFLEKIDATWLHKMQVWNRAIDACVERGDKLASKEVELNGTWQAYYDLNERNVIADVIAELRKLEEEG